MSLLDIFVLWGVAALESILEWWDMRWDTPPSFWNGEKEKHQLMRLLHTPRGVFVRMGAGFDSSNVCCKKESLTNSQ